MTKALEVVVAALILYGIAELAIAFREMVRASGTWIFAKLVKRSRTKRLSGNPVDYGPCVICRKDGFATYTDLVGHEHGCLLRYFAAMSDRLSKVDP